MHHSQDGGLTSNSFYGAGWYVNLESNVQKIASNHVCVGNIRRSGTGTYSVLYSVRIIGMSALDMLPSHTSFRIRSTSLQSPPRSGRDHVITRLTTYALALEVSNATVMYTNPK